MLGRELGPGSSRDGDQNCPFSWRMYLLQNFSFLDQTASTLHMLSNVNLTDFITKCV